MPVSKGRIRLPAMTRALPLPSPGCDRTCGCAPQSLYPGGDSRQRIAGGDGAAPPDADAGQGGPGPAHQGRGHRRADRHSDRTVATGGQALDLGRYDLLSRDNFNPELAGSLGAVAERVGRKLRRDAATDVDLVRKAALAALRAMNPVNELQTMRVEMLKLSSMPTSCSICIADMDAALHLFTASSRPRGRGAGAGRGARRPGHALQRALCAGTDVLGGERRALAPPRGTPP